MSNTFHTIKAENDGQIREITELAEIIWHEYFVPIIGKEQVEYMRIFDTPNPEKP